VDRHAGLLRDDPQEIEVCRAEPLAGVARRDEQLADRLALVRQRNPLCVA
jgi:hypothetical protein